MRRAQGRRRQPPYSPGLASERSGEAMSLGGRPSTAVPSTLGRDRSSRFGRWRTESGSGPGRRARAASPPGSDPFKECAGGLTGRSPRREEPDMRKLCAALAITAASLAIFEGCAPGPLAALCSLQAEASRRVARRLRKPSPGGRRVGAVLAARPALAHDAVPNPRRQRSLISARALRQECLRHT